MAVTRARMACVLLALPGQRGVARERGGRLDAHDHRVAGLHAEAFGEAGVDGEDFAIGGDRGRSGAAEGPETVVAPTT